MPTVEPTSATSAEFLALARSFVRAWAEWREALRPWLRVSPLEAGTERYSRVYNAHLAANAAMGEAAERLCRAIGRDPRWFVVDGRRFRRQWDRDGRPQNVIRVRPLPEEN